MRFIAKKVTVQDLQTLLADAKAEAARGAGRSGIMIGTLVTLLLTGTVLALFFIAGLLRLAEPNQSDGRSVIPPLGAEQK